MAVIEINVKKDKKIVEVWLTNAEQNDTAVIQSVDNIIENYRRENYRVAIFKSGNGNLLHATKQLILKNFV